jgi:hypothetical protein
LRLDTLLEFQSMSRDNGREYDPVLIDEKALDQEVFDQSRRSRQAGEIVADMRHLASRAKGRFELVKAQLALTVKQKPHKYGFLGKPTLDDIKAMVITLPEYQEAQEAMFQADHDKDDAEAEYWAFNHRKDMLGKAVELHHTNYHSDPKFFKKPYLRKHQEEFREAVLRTANPQRRSTLTKRDE